MEEKENAMMNIHVHTVNDLVLKAGKYEDFRKKGTLQLRIAEQERRRQKKQQRMQEFYVLYQDRFMMTLL